MVRAAALIAFALALAPSASRAAEVIRLEPGPLDGVKIDTPWGDFVAVQEGDSVWVGSEAEYEASVAHAIMHANGARELCNRGGRGCNNFVEADLPHVRMGSVEVAGVTLNPLFDTHSRHKPSGVPQTTLSLSWEQVGAPPSRPVILDKVTGATYSARSCGIDVGISHCEMVVPQATLPHPAAIVFVSRGSPPGVLKTQALSQTIHDTISEHLRSLAHAHMPVSPSDPNDDSYRDLTRLHEIDPAVSATPDLN